MVVCAARLARLAALLHGPLTVVKKTRCTIVLPAQVGELPVMTALWEADDDPNQRKTWQNTDAYVVALRWLIIYARQCGDTLREQRTNFRLVSRDVYDEMAEDDRKAGRPPHD